MEQMTATYLPLNSETDGTYVIEFPDGSIATTQDGPYNVRPILVRSPMQAYAFLVRNQPVGDECRRKGGWRTVKANDLQVYLGRYIPRFKGLN